jgi:hypothetical protein
LSRRGGAVGQRPDGDGASVTLRPRRAHESGGSNDLGFRQRSGYGAEEFRVKVGRQCYADAHDVGSRLADGDEAEQQGAAAAADENGPARLQQRKGFTLTTFAFSAVS